jgi:hypothetical protein
MIDEDTQVLSRPQRRLLRRVYNGRTEPVMADGKPFLTYRLARDYLEALTPEERDAAYLEMKAQAR